MDSPTKKQIVVLKAILAFQKTNDGNSPSYRDLAEILESSLGNMQAHIACLKRDGHIKHTKGNTRNLKVLWKP